jgi:hypothetical protein
MKKALLLIAGPEVYSENLPGSILISVDRFYLDLALAAGCIDFAAAVGGTALADFGSQMRPQSRSSVKIRLHLRPLSVLVADLQKVLEAVKSTDGFEYGGVRRY